MHAVRYAESVPSVLLRARVERRAVMAVHGRPIVLTPSLGRRHVLRSL